MICMIKSFASRISQSAKFADGGDDENDFENSIPLCLISMVNEILKREFKENGGVTKALQALTWGHGPTTAEPLTEGN